MIKKMNGFLGLMMLPVILCFVFFFVLQGIVNAQAVKVSERPTHKIPKIESKIHVDGVMDEEAWQHALKLDINYEIYPGENIPAPVKTEVFLAYSHSYLYVAFHAYDPNPSAIRALYNDRDNIWRDDFVAITLDTFNDHLRRFSFFCNPLGVQTDFIETLEEELISWDGLWESAGKIVDGGYIVEMAIPFATLRFQRKSGDQEWRFNVVRSYPRDVKHSLSLFPLDRNNSCAMCQADKMVGFAGVKPGKNIEIDPTLTAVYTQGRENFTEGKFVKKESKLSPGVTAQWGFTPNMTLSAAVNPDFSNVEADAAQLNINTQYALYYPERRPFFLEGTSFFNTRLPIVYTRSLADPDWGIKLSGKEGKNTIGFFSVQDKITNFLFPSSWNTLPGSLNKRSVGTVLRYIRNLGNTSSVGITVSDREGKGYYNRLFSIDSYFRFTTSDTLQLQLAGSQTRYPAAVASKFGQSLDRIKGTALDVYFKHASRNVQFYGLFRKLSPDFRADLGFITQVDYRHMESGFQYDWLHNPGFWYNKISLGSSYEYETDHTDQLIYKAFNVSSIYNGPAQTSVTLTGSLGKRQYLGNIFNMNHGRVYFEMQPSTSFAVALESIFGRYIDFDNVRQGKRFRINPALLFKVGRHLSLSLDHLIEILNVDAGRLYSANITNTRVVYQFDRRTFLRAIVQYINYNYNVANYLFPVDPRFKHLFTQVLFSYKINPRTVLFLGYSDNYYAFTPVHVRQTDRTVFLKIGYALVL